VALGTTALDLVGNCVIFTFSGSFFTGVGFFSDGIGMPSNKPCKASEISSMGRIQNCSGAGKFFRK
jgi:hypothetical protein